MSRPIRGLRRGSSRLPRALIGAPPLIVAVGLSAWAGGVLGTGIAASPPARKAPPEASQFKVVNNTTTCAPATVTATYQSNYSRTPVAGYYVTTTSVGSVPAGCNGDTLTVDLTNSSNQTIGTGTRPISSTPVVVQMGPSGGLHPYARDVTGITIIFSSNTIHGNVEVDKGQAFNCTGGMTINGNVTVDRDGDFTGTHCTINGNLTSAGTASLDSSTVTGNVETSAGLLTLTSQTSVGGNVHAHGGGPVTVTNSSVTGDLQLQSLTSATAGMVCATRVNHDVSLQGSAEPFLLGGSSGCPENKIGGNLLVQSNTGKLTIGAGNASSSAASGMGNMASGNIQVQNNTTGKGSTLAGNWAGGNCTLQNDNPVIQVPSSTSNVASKNNKCRVGA